MRMGERVDGGSQRADRRTSRPSRIVDGKADKQTGAGKGEYAGRTSWVGSGRGQAGWADGWTRADEVASGRTDELANKRTRADNVRQIAQRVKFPN